MGDRIAYVPWTRASNLANEYVAKVQSWNDDKDQTHGKHEYDLVFYQDLNAKQLIRALQYGHRIYIKGHGMPGSHKIFPNNSCNDAEGMKYDDVCDHLIDSGLQKRWVGVIVCDNCYSAVPNTGMQAFAAKVSQYMRSKGYLLISFIGYFGPATSKYDVPDRDGHKYWHREVRPFDEDVPLIGAKAGSNLEQWRIKSKWAQFRF